eukprot:CAMPEP_0184677168 /NCGR_PEP_ID=MMETSP0308-20130426/88742_1 /TAXON_ID=38269 /ORGANISM="Gloeochaete witrockiana, Strain SAG 46.84" /LENGTH=69 /DNA_ID=CAMNT_0027125049 /DNA_START=185 /DNA_END=394 /DNA_ORIENTATION=-
MITIALNAKAHRTNPTDPTPIAIGTALVEEEDGDSLESLDGPSGAWAEEDVIAVSFAVARKPNEVCPSW